MKTSLMIIGALTCAAQFLCAVQAEEVQSRNMVAALGNREILHDCHKFPRWNMNCDECCKGFGLFAAKQLPHEPCDCETESRHNKRERRLKRREEKKVEKRMQAALRNIYS